MTKPLRTAMPFVTSIIDDFREHFPEADVVAAVRAGMDGQPLFHAVEGGLEVGTPFPDLSARAVSLKDIQTGANADLLKKR